MSKFPPDIYVYDFIDHNGSIHILEGGSPMGSTFQGYDRDNPGKMQREIVNIYRKRWAESNSNSSNMTVVCVLSDPHYEILEKSRLIVNSINEFLEKKPEEVGLSVLRELWEYLPEGDVKKAIKEKTLKRSENFLSGDSANNILSVFSLVLSKLTKAAILSLYDLKDYSLLERTFDEIIPFSALGNVSKEEKIFIPFAMSPYGTQASVSALVGCKTIIPFVMVNKVALVAILGEKYYIPKTCFLFFCSRTPEQDRDKLNQFIQENDFPQYIFKLNSGCGGSSVLVIKKQEVLSAYNMLMSTNPDKNRAAQVFFQNNTITFDQLTSAQKKVIQELLNSIKNASDRLQEPFIIQPYIEHPKITIEGKQYASITRVVVEVKDSREVIILGAWNRVAFNPWDDSTLDNSCIVVGATASEVQKNTDLRILGHNQEILRQRLAPIILDMHRSFFCCDSYFSQKRFMSKPELWNIVSLKIGEKNQINFGQSKLFEPAAHQLLLNSLTIFRKKEYGVMFRAIEDGQYNKAFRCICNASADNKDVVKIVEIFLKYKNDLKIDPLEKNKDGQSAVSLAKNDDVKKILAIFSLPSQRTSL